MFTILPVKMFYKMDIRDSACTRDRSSSPDYSDMLSEESTEECYFKRAHRHSTNFIITGLLFYMSILKSE